MVIKILIVLNTLGCRSSGISFCTHKESVILLILYKMMSENKINQNETKPESLLAKHSCIITIPNNDEKRY